MTDVQIAIFIIATLMYLILEIGSMIMLYKKSDDDNIFLGFIIGNFVFNVIYISLVCRLLTL